MSLVYEKQAVIQNLIYFMQYMICHKICIIELSIKAKKLRLRNSFSISISSEQANGKTESKSKSKNNMQNEILRSEKLVDHSFYNTYTGNIKHHLGNISKGFDGLN